MYGKYIIKKNGNNPNRLGILICTHGDETIGFKAMKIIENHITNVSFIIVNKKAFDLGRKYIEFDLNRCFLGNAIGKGIDSYEYKLSKELHMVLKDFHNLIDIHSTDFDIDPYIIVDNIKKNNLNIVNCIDKKFIKNIYVIPFSKGTLIGNYINAIAIECGHNDDQNRVNQIAEIIKNVSDNLYGKTFFQKNIHTFLGEMKKGNIIRLYEKTKDFNLIKEGSKLGYDKESNIIYSDQDIRLLFVNNKFNNNILAIKLNLI
ncbi:succinylglutamate desuccinylase/aspartoacylase family protein [Candidatus Gracilibacteria bacterium]|nr:succinylglutamate desuccinylase/aspartoacylase family protein [Candidatus Gracilibacteria bacterium]